MPPLVTWIALGIGAALIWLREEEKPVTKPLPTVKKEEQPTKEELRKVMRHLGKRSGVARGGK